jgi:hypothetical protein
MMRRWTSAATILALALVLALGCNESSRREVANGGVLEVTLTPDPLRVGLPGDSGTDRSGTMAVTVKPAKKRGDVGLRSSNTDRATIVVGDWNVEGGEDGVATAEITVTGQEATPAGEEDGDCDVEAVVDGKVVEEATVFVVIPAGTDPPADSNQVVTGRNIRFDTTTSPTNPDFGNQLGPNDTALMTFYGTTVNVPVVDQFGDAVGDIYGEGNAAVVEQLAQGTPFALNVVLGADSTYPDPVGHAVEKSAAPVIVQVGSADEVNWTGAGAPS